MPLGILIGGLILNSPAIGTNGQLNNYIAVFIVCLVGQIISLIWVLIMINEKQQLKTEPTPVKASDGEISLNSLETLKVQPDESGGSIKMEDLIQSEVPKNNEADEITENTKTEENAAVIKVNYAEKYADEKWYEALKYVFSIKNVRQMIVTSIKERPNNGRAQIFLLLASEAIIILCFMGSGSILFQFVQKAYNWNSGQFSNWNAFGSIFSTLIMLFSVPILVKVLKCTDPILGVIGVSSLFIQILIRGSILYSTAFIAAYFMGAFNGIGHLSIRTRLSKIVGKDEIGQVFGFLSCIESLVPLAASSFYSFIFNATIGFHPGLVFQLACILLFIPLLVFIWVDLFVAKTNLEVE